jgi:hypothetical protein
VPTEKTGSIVMKANNFDIKANGLFNAVGYVKELGDYACRYSQEAYEALEIEGELDNDEWCDLMVADNGKIYAVAGDSEATQSGEFFFKQIIVIKEKDLKEKISEAAEEIYDTDPNMCVTIGVSEQGDIYVSSLHFQNESVYKTLPFCVDIEGGYAEDESEEEKKETLNSYEEFIEQKFDEQKDWSDLKIIYI